MINPTAIFVVIFFTAVAHLCGNWVWGVAIGTGILVAVEFIPDKEI